jgi:phage/conjugal plasmid C-4 type zinc finger TraR family protein
VDDADIAQRNRECLEGLQLRARLEAMPCGEAAEECEDCGKPIPETRRQAAPGCTRCIGCQQRFERRLKERR